MIIKWLRRLDLMTLRKASGETILSAINSIVKSGIEKELSEILHLKYGSKILEHKEIRLSILDTLNANEALTLSNNVQLNIVGLSSIQIIAALRKYFNSYNKSKSIILSDFLGLDQSYYKQEIIETRLDIERIDIGKDEFQKTKSYLHHYQKRIKDNINIRLNADAISTFMVQMPTGSGKTYTAQEVLVDTLRSPKFNKYIVWIVDSKELAEQALMSFKQLWKLKGDKPINAFRLYESFEPDFALFSNGGVVFAGFDKFNSVITNSNHKAYEKIWYLIENTELVIVDEAHKSIAETYNNCIKCFTNRNSKLIGLTATPGRSDPDETKELVDLFSNEVVKITNEDGSAINDIIGYLQDHEYLANIKAYLLETEINVDESVEGRILETLSKNSSRNEKIMDQIELADKNNESTLVFACTLDHVFALTILCRHKQIKSEFIVGETDSVKRIEILNSFKNKEINVLINLDILSTGIDIPKLDKLIITRPIGSPILYSQIIGRALRGKKNGGNQRNTIINVKDNLLNYPDANSIYNIFKEDWMK